MNQRGSFQKVRMTIPHQQTLTTNVRDVARKEPLSTVGGAAN